MVDKYFLEVSLPRMSLEALAEAYHIARLYRMYQLGEVYIAEIGKRLSVQNFLKVNFYFNWFLLPFS